MSTTFTLDTATSRAHPTPVPMKRLTVPAIQNRKVDGQTAEPLVMLTAYTARQAQLLDPHCDMLLVGDSLGQVIYGLPSTLAVTLDMMCAHGAAVVRAAGLSDDAEVADVVAAVEAGRRRARIQQPAGASTSSAPLFNDSDDANTKPASVPARRA